MPYLNRDIFFKLCQYLGLNDAFNLARTSPQLEISNDEIFDVVLKYATKRLKNELRDIGWTSELIKSLQSTNSIIAGSFPLQCILNEEWDGSDIDIFTKDQDKNFPSNSAMSSNFFKMIPNKFELLTYTAPSEEFKIYCVKCHKSKGEGCDHIKNNDTNDLSFWEKILEYWKSQGFLAHSIIFKIFIYFHHLRFNRTTPIRASVIEMLKERYPLYLHVIGECASNKMPSGQCLTTYNTMLGRFNLKEFNFYDRKGERSKIQIITPEDEEPLDCVRRFDFDFCKVYFDGKQIHVMDQNSIITRSSKINPEANTNSDRKLKYEKRGFKIIEDVDPDEA